VRTLPFCLLALCVRTQAATIEINSGFGSNLVGSPPPGVASVTDDKQFTYNINDRSDLTPGLPILVTFNVPQLSAQTYSVWVQNTGTFRDTFTVSALLGGSTGSVISSTHVSLFQGSGTGTNVPGGMLSVTFPGPFSFTVPWETDLTALSMTVRQMASIDGAGNGITMAGAGGLLTITTQSVPESSVGILAAAAGMLLIGKRKRMP
jgi:hypothetical protein